MAITTAQKADIVKQFARGEALWSVENGEPAPQPAELSERQRSGSLSHPDRTSGSAQVICVIGCGSGAVVAIGLFRPAAIVFPFFRDALPDAAKLIPFPKRMRKRASPWCE